MKKSVIVKELLLVLATLIWGIAFVFQSTGMEFVEPFTFNVGRSFVASLFLLIVIIILDIKNKKKKEEVKKENFKQLLIGGSLCGIALFAAMAFQQFGVMLLGAGKAGFITATYIIFVPLFGLFLGQKINKYIVIGIIFSFTGLYLININSGENTINIGTIILLGGAVSYAIQILLIDKYSKICDNIKLSGVQFLVAGIITLPFMFIFEEPTWSNILHAYVPILFVGIFSSGVAFTLQIYAQSYVKPVIASLIMSLESVFAMFFGILLLNERYGVYEAIGCLLIFIAIIVSQIPVKVKIKA